MSALLSGPDAQIPVTILTGFLGSGKTTLLNRFVRMPEAARTLVIINEFGAVGLDHELIVRSSDDLVVEMMGGCLCCTIRGDLAATLRDAPWRFAREGRCWFDRVVIETTGLADPAPILHTLMTDEALLALYRIDGVVATVDAAVGMETLDSQMESLKQAAVADRIVLTKTDLAASALTEALGRRLAILNPAAPVMTAVNGEMDFRRILDTGLYDPSTKTHDVQRWLAAERYDHSGHHHHDHHPHDINRHDERIRAICLTFDEPLKPEAFERWLDILAMLKGQDFLRIKGIVNLRGMDRPVVVHGVQHVFHPPVVLDAWPSEDRRTRLVMIVRDMCESELRGTLALMTLGLDRFGLTGLGMQEEAAGGDIAPR